jgi:hypothetical protein
MVLARIRQRDAVRSSIEQPYANLLLESAHYLAQRRWRTPSASAARLKVGRRTS